MRCGAKMVSLRREMSEVEKRKKLSTVDAEVGAQRTLRDLR
jgi:hypothetical protein